MQQIDKINKANAGAAAFEGKEAERQRKEQMKKERVC